MGSGLPGKCSYVDYLCLEHQIGANLGGWRIRGGDDEAIQLGEFIDGRIVGNFVPALAVKFDGRIESLALDVRHDRHRLGIGGLE